MRRWAYNDVKQYFEDNNCILLESIYVNNRTPMNYICSCNNKSKIRFDDFKYGYRCKQCGKEKCKEIRTFSQEYVENYFKEHGCELLDTYISSKKKVEYRCSCGNISNINFNCFQQGQRCYNCRNTKISIKLSGSNHYNWNPDRNIIRKREEIHTLSESYKKKFKRKHKIIEKYVHVDHIFPVKAFIDYGIFDLDIINSEDNLQILNAKENLSKGDKYNKNEFIKKYGDIIKCH